MHKKWPFKVSLLGKTFDRCTQWTSLDSRQDYLDFIGRPYNDEPSDITFVGQQYLDRNKIPLP